MATTMGPQAPTRGNARASGRAGATGREHARASDREQQYDLVTAALIGILVGAGTTMLLRRGPGGERPLTPLVGAAARGVRTAGLAAAGGARRMGIGRRRRGWARRGREALGQLHLDEIGDDIRDTFEAIRDTVADAVETELRDLRKSVRRQKRRLGF